MPAEALRPDPKRRQAIEAIVHADSRMCWTCKACLSECPVNIATSRLQPMKLVRMANLGLLDELIHLPEIWYCMTCNRCNDVCPMLVKPAALVLYGREQALQSGMIPYETVRRYRELFFNFQKVRWQAALQIQQQGSVAVQADLWHRWLEGPIATPDAAIDGGHLFTVSAEEKKALAESASNACFTCSECSNACPVFAGRGIFDPMWVFRMTNLGMLDELLHSPSIWLCVQCQRCTRACSQQVQGHMVLRRLQELALREGAVSDNFRLRWVEAGRDVYTRFIEEVNALFGFDPSQTK